MSRLLAVTADELLSGTRANTMAAYYGSDDEVPGVVTLGSINGMPNPDLVDVNERGRVRGWKTKAPPSPDSWNVYMRRLTSINASGNHVVISGGAPMLRQNESLLPSTDHTYQQDHPLLTNKSLPDISRDEPTDLAPPLEAPRVEVITTAGNVGYPAGSLWCSYVGIVGDNPMGTPRITNCAPAVQVSGIAQGQVLLFYLPDEAPDSWTGVGFVAGSTSANMKLQKRVDIRGKVILTTTGRMYRRSGPTITTASNRTTMGSLNQFGSPRHWRASSGRVLRVGNYELSYQLRTPQGWTASQQIASVSIGADREGEEIAWTPPDGAKKQKDIIAWRPQFKGNEGNWYTFADAAGEGYDLNKAARLHTRRTDKDRWNDTNAAVKSDRQEVDRSGLAGPVDAMETPLAQGAQQMLPGKYAVRATNASEKLGMESRPTPRTVVTLRDAGLNAGGAATFVTDQSLRVYRPHPQRIKNARLLEVDPVTGTQDLHWERFSATGVSITTADGFITVADTSLATTVQAYRRSSIEPVDPARTYTVRWRMNVTRWVSGVIRINLRFLDSAQALISTVNLEDFSSVQNGHVKYTFGPENGAANYDMPANAAYVQVGITAASGTARNFDFSVSNIGLFVGRINPRKLYDLVLAEDTPGHDVWPVPEEEDATLHYPPGPYCRVVTSPTDPATKRVPSYLEQKGFEDGSLTSGTWTSVTTTGVTNTVALTYALRGLYGMRSDALATTVATWSGYIWKDYFLSTRSTFGVETTYRLQKLVSGGNVSVLGVSRDANLTSYLAHAQVTSAGAVNLLYWNGTAMATLASTVVAQQGDDLRIELVFSGLRTASGSVSMIVKRNHRPNVTTTASSLNWVAGNPGGNVYRVLVGHQNGGTSSVTSRLIFDRIRITTSGMQETTTIPGNYVEYWAPEGQPAGDPEHFMTGARFPVSPSTTYVFSAYTGYDGITTPSDGAKLFRLVAKDTDGNSVGDLGWLATGLLGRDYWDRYYFSYTTPADAVYVEVERNHVGDGLIRAMGFQNEPGTTPTAFTNTNATSGTFNVILKVTPTSGPLDGNAGFTDSILRARAVATHQYDVNNVAITTVTQRMRGAGNTTTLASATWYTTQAAMTNAIGIPEYIEVETTLTTTDATKSPEVRAVFVDVKRAQPVLTREDGRDFHGGILVYQLTPASPIPNVIRKEYADGSVGRENVGRGRPPERLKLSLEALTETGKRQAERNPATDEPLFRVENNGTLYFVAMSPEFAGATELRPDGTDYWDYTAEGLEADVEKTEDA